MASNSEPNDLDQQQVESFQRLQRHSVDVSTADLQAIQAVLMEEERLRAQEQESLSLVQEMTAAMENTTSNWTSARAPTRRRANVRRRGRRSEVLVPTFFKENANQYSGADYQAIMELLTEQNNEAAAMRMLEDEISDSSRAGLSQHRRYTEAERVSARRTAARRRERAKLVQEQISEMPVELFDPSNRRNEDEGNETETTCLICQSSYERDEIVRRLCCGHCFHMACVDKWLKKNDTCPYCKFKCIDPNRKMDSRTIEC